MTSDVLVPVSVGDLFDKVTILEIKMEKIQEADKLANIARELDSLQQIANPIRTAAIDALCDQLRDVNTRIWEAEDAIREFERTGIFDDAFLAVARSIYRLNDARAKTKRTINAVSGSSIIEEKSYSAY
jgi:hypothetical protein